MKTNYQAARQNMVDCQVRPAGVIDAGVLKAFENVPREVFAPQDKADIAYFDEDLALGNGRYLIEPRAHAMMVEALDIRADDVVLDIAGASGYSAAILSSLATTVIMVEQDEELLTQAQKNWEDLDIGNVAAFHAPLEEGDIKHAPFAKIFFGGTVSEVPQNWLDQLAPLGRMVGLVRPHQGQQAKAMLFEKTAEGVVSSRPLFDAACPYLPDMEPKESFSF